MPGKKKTSSHKPDETSAKKHQFDEQENIVDNQDQTEQDPLQVCQQERDEYKEMYLRALADYRNAEQRALNEKADIRVSSEMTVLEQILPFLDNLKRAEVFIKDEGLQMIKKEFERIIEDLGVREVELLGKEFDPAVAEVIEVVDGAEENTITEVILSAYAYKDRILRHGQVKVSQKSQS